MSDPTLGLLLAPIGATAINVLIHLIFCATTRLNHLLAIVAAFILPLPLAAVFTAASIGPSDGVADFAGYVLLNLLTYGALGYGYFTVVNLTATSLRMNLMRAIAARGDEGATVDDLLTVYQADMVLETRTARLLNWRQLHARDERLYVQGTPLFLRLHRLIILLRRAVYGVADGNRHCK